MRSAAPCDAVREAISARADGEEATTPPEVVAGHVARCARCRAFGVQIDELARRCATGRAGPVPDTTDEILVAVACSERRGGRPGAARTWLPRSRWGWVVGWAAAAVPLALAVPVLAAGGPTRGTPHQAAHPSAAPRVGAPRFAASDVAGPCTLVLAWPRRS